ncbi:MAG: lytic transglycosylase domain-containing protein [Bryobacteraceae bacterium]|nr:lytic transglycosylase domain-containing protein [Bryobacteraceae bacterium]
MYALASAGILCAAQPEKTRAVQVADHYSDLYQVPRELVYSIVEMESNWKPHVVSDKGAVGLMQLIPATAATFGVTNRFDIEQNVRGGVAYLARLLKLFDGDVRLAGAAYFAGEGRIQKAGLGYSNAEVYRYVRRLTRLYWQKRFEAEQTLRDQ